MYRISTGPFRKKDISKILVLRAKERRHNKETKIFGTVSLIGGLKKKKQKSPNLNFGILKTYGGI